MGIIRKDKYNIIYNHNNEHVPADYGLDWSDEEMDSQKTEFASMAVNEEGKAESTNTFVLSDVVVQAREAEALAMRKRIREKQKLFLELIKQQVSMTKLKTRNVEAANQLLNASGGVLNVDRSTAHSAQKLQLPLLFVECQPDSRIKIS